MRRRSHPDRGNAARHARGVNAGTCCLFAVACGNTLTQSTAEDRIVRITSKGQVTIPRDIRDALGIVPSSEVEFVREGNRVWLHKRKPGAARGRSLVARMRGRATARMSTEEILSLTHGDGA